MTRWWAFIPYLIVGALHLYALFASNFALAGPTKGMLMLALLLALLVALPRRRSEIAVWGSLGILFSLLGDLLLSSPEDNGFVVGLGSFMVAHVCYLVLFFRPLRTRRVPPVVVVALLVWWGTLLAVLWPHLVVLLVPVAFYGLIVGASTAGAFGTSRTVSVGAVLFLVSDTLLAFKLFYPDFSMWEADFVIMLAYILGQGLIALGVVRQAQAAATP